jgi:ElaA protein
VVDPGAKYDEPSIGRVLTTSATRGQGLGRELVHQAIVRTQEAWPRRGIRISAQSRLEAFYASFGFAAVGAAYLDDGIEHVDMLLAGPNGR